MSETEKTLVKKLAKVMQEVKYIQKTGFNSFHKYKYATEADVNEKVREELAKQNVIMLPSMTGHEMRTHTNRNGATEYIICVDMQFTFVDGDSGESFTVNMSGEGQDAGDKGMYKAIAGAQKYALMKVFMIPTGDDPEADEGVDERNQGNTKSKAATNKETPPPPSWGGPQNPPQAPSSAKGKTISEAQQRRLFAICGEHGVPTEEVKAKISAFGFASTKDLDKKTYDLVCEWAENYDKDNFTMPEEG